MTTQLIRYEAARTALAEAHRVDEVKDIRDKAEAMAAYARQAKDQDLIQYATEIKVRAERKCGELLAKVERSDGGRPEKNSSKPETSYQATLRENDLHPAAADRYQQLAAMPEEHFETAVATAKATAGEVTTAFMLRAAKSNAKRPRAERIEEMRALAQGGHLVEQIAEKQGIGVEHARNLLNGAGIKIQVQKRGRGIDPNKIVRESVSALSGIAQGLSLVRSLDIEAEEAEALLSELRSAMKSLRTLDATLKEITNGK